MRVLLSLFLLSILIPTSFCITCPKEYFSVGGAKCLKMYWDAASHSDAERICVADGATLVTIKNAIDNRLVYNFASESGFYRIWIGLSCFGNTTDSCYWDDASGTAASYSNFYSQPGQLSCTLLYLSGGIESLRMKWISTMCNDVNNLMTQSSPYVCEAPVTVGEIGGPPLCTLYNNYCYARSDSSDMFYAPPSSAQNASSICQHYPNKFLASIHSKMELDFIRNIYKGSNVTSIYIGAQASLLTDKMSWIDGTEWDFDYMNPFDTNQGMCLVMDVQGDGLWSRVDCNQKFDFLCKNRIPLFPTSAPVLSAEIQKTPKPEILLNSSNCNSTLVLAPGSISTPGWPGFAQRSGDMSYCTWRLAALGPYRIGLYFNSWKTFGSLNIFDENGRNIGNLTGINEKGPFTKYTPFNIATVTFVPINTNDTRLDNGFHAVILPL